MSSSNSELQLLDVETDDHDKIVARINTFYTNDTSTKTMLAYNWERNQLMLDGRQWIVWDDNKSSGGLWKTLKVTKQNEYIPRPVTNYLFSSYQTLKAYLIKNKPRSSVRPNTQEWRDKNASKLANLCLEANWTRLKEQYNYEVAAANLVTYGTVFKKDFWDTTAKSMVKVPRMEPKPITDPQTGAVIGQTEEEAIDPTTGDPLFDLLPLGDLNTTILDPFRVTLDPLAMNLHESRWVMEYSVQTLDWIKQTYQRDEEGYTGRAELVEEDKQLNSSMRRWFQLRTTSGVKQNTGALSEGMTASDVMIENAAVVKEYYEAPSLEYPKGREIVVAGDQCLYAGDSPYEGPEQGDWHPYSECRWEIVPGRFWGKSPFDDAVEIQKRINSIDSVIALIRKTMAIPQKMIPIGSGIEPGSWTGRPGQQNFYRHDGTGAMPTTVPGVGPDASVMQERAQCVGDIKEITGAIDILKGDRPPGVNAASALNLLYEVGTGKLFPILDRWKMYVESSQKKQLRILQKFYKEQRPDYIRMLRAQNQDLSEDDINKFIGSDLYDNCNVVVEAGSNVPKLQASKQAMLVELAQMGMLNLQNPENRVQFQEDMGIAGYDSDVEPDRRRATWENDLLDNIQNSPDNKPVVLDVDNDQLHVEEHSNRMKSPNFMSLPFPVQQAYMMHIQEHEQSQNKKMQAQMLQQQAMAPAPGATGQAPQTPAAAAQGQPQGAHGGHGHGMSKPLQNAVLGSDILTPATLGQGSRP